MEAGSASRYSQGRISNGAVFFLTRQKRSRPTVGTTGLGWLRQPTNGRLYGCSAFGEGPQRLAFHPVHRHSLCGFAPAAW